MAFKLGERAGSRTDSMPAASRVAAKSPHERHYASAPPHQVPGGAGFETGTAATPPSPDWFQTRHHQGKSRANGHCQLAYLLPAILAGLIIPRLPGAETPFPLQTAPNKRRRPLSAYPIGEAPPPPRNFQPATYPSAATTGNVNAPGQNRQKTRDTCP